MIRTQWISFSVATTVPSNLWFFTLPGKLSGTLLNSFGSETVSNVLTLPGTNTQLGRPTWEHRRQKAKDTAWESNQGQGSGSSEKTSPPHWPVSLRLQFISDPFSSWPVGGGGERRWPLRSHMAWAFLGGHGTQTIWGYMTYSPHLQSASASLLHPHPLHATQAQSNQNLGKMSSLHPSDTCPWPEEIFSPLLLSAVLLWPHLPCQSRQPSLVA